MDQEVWFIQVLYLRNCLFLFLVTHFGIALPKWLVDHKNSVFVLLIYASVFMIVLPVIIVRKLMSNFFCKITLFFVFKSVCGGKNQHVMLVIIY